MGDSGPAHEVGTFSSRTDDLLLGEILPVVYSRDSPAMSRPNLGAVTGAREWEGIKPPKPVASLTVILIPIYHHTNA